MVALHFIPNNVVQGMESGLLGEDHIGVHVTLTNVDRLRAVLRLPEAMEDSRAMIHWVLVLDGRPYQRSSTRSAEAEWQLVPSGLYLVQATIDVPGIPPRLFRSQTITFVGPEAESELKKLFRGDSAASLPFAESLRYAPLSTPFQELLVVGARVGSEFDGDRVQQAARSLHATAGLSMQKPTVTQLGDLRISVLATGSPPCELRSHATRNSSVWLSGLLHRHRSTIRSFEDLSAFARQGGYAEDLLNSTGSYTLVQASGESVSVSADYFGFNRWYLFEGKNFVVAANGYHLLLEFLVGAGQLLALNRSALLSQLWSMRCQATMQNFSRHMGVAGVRQMTVAERLILDRGGWKLDETPLRDVLADRSVLSKAEFTALMKLGVNEITSNLDSAVSDSRNEHVLIDLSGGLDSRVVFAAFESMRPTVDTSACLVNSRDTPGSRDLEVALSLVGDQLVRWNDSPELREWLQPEVSDQISRSHYLGTYYSHNLWLSRVLDDKTVVLNGACGEVLARPYLARNLFGTSCDSSVNIEMFMDELHHQWAHLSDTSCPEVWSAWRETFCQELIDQECDNSYEALDRMYMSYRHAYHFDPSYAHSFIHLNLMPMQSPALLNLHHKMYKSMRGLELQGALLMLLNPALASHEYESERDNRDMSNVIGGELSSASTEVAGRQREAWNAAQVRKRAALKFVNRRPDEWARLAEKQYEATHRALRRLCRADELDLSTTLKRDLHRALVLMKDNPGRVRFAYNRFLSIVDQVEIVQRSRAVSGRNPSVHRANVNSIGVNLERA